MSSEYGSTDAWYQNEIAKLEADRDRLRSDLAASFAAGLKIEQRARECEAERDSLRELLRPAAAFADVLDSDEIFEEMREPETIIATLDDAVLTASDCYAARAALEDKT